MDPMVPHPQERQIVPQRQMLDLNQPTRMGAFYPAMAAPTFKATTHPFQIQDHGFTTLAHFLTDANNPKPLYLQKFCKTIRSHLVRSPFRLFSGKCWENNLPDASIFTNTFHNNSS
jgi:hypothetical protein